MLQGMTDLGHVWLFTRERLRQSLVGLTDQDLHRRITPTTHSMGEIVLHIAGAEHYWSARMTGRDPSATDLERKLDLAIFDGFLREGGCPFSPDEITIGSIERVLSFTYERIFPIYDEPMPEQLTMPLISPVGDHVDGHEGLVRLAQHGGYHTGQVWLIRMALGI